MKKIIGLLVFCGLVQSATAALQASIKSFTVSIAKNEIVCDESMIDEIWLQKTNPKKWAQLQKQKAKQAAAAAKARQLQGVFLENTLGDLGIVMPTAGYLGLSDLFGFDKVVNILKWLTGNGPDNYADESLGEDFRAVMLAMALPEERLARYGVNHVMTKDALIATLKKAEGTCDIVVHSQHEAEEIIKAVWGKYISFDAYTYDKFQWKKGCKGVAQIHPPEYGVPNHLDLPHYRVVVNQPKKNGDVNTKALKLHFYFEICN